MAAVTIGEVSLPVASAELTLSVGAGPLLRLQPSSGHRVPDELHRTLFGALERGTFTWGEEELTFRFLAAHPGRDGGYEITGLVLPEELLDWFDTHEMAADGRSMLVYQRQQTDNDGWSFLRRVLGDRFEEPLFSTELEPWLPVGTTILRPTGWTNLAHLRRVIGLVGGLPGATCSWCAFNTEGGDEPLRFVSASAEPLPLDDKWRLLAASRSGVPHQLSHNGGERYEIRRRFPPLQVAEAAAILVELACSGRRAMVESCADVSITGQLPHMPMPVQLRDTTFLCERAVYRFSAGSTLAKESEAPTLDVQLFLSGLPTHGWGDVIRHTALGLFGSWDEPSGKTRLRIKSDAQNWTLMGDGGSDDAGGSTEREAAALGMALVCESVTPFAARGDFSGFYVKHQVDDQLVVDIADLAVPRSRGGLQVYAEKLEGPELTLNARTIVQSGVSNQAKLNVTATLVDGESGVVEVYAEEHVKLKDRVTVVDAGTTAAHDLLVKGETEIEKDTKIGGELEVDGNTKIKGTCDVGS